MKEVKTPKKPLAIYYAIVLLVLMLLNFVLVPWMSERHYHINIRQSLQPEYRTTH